MLSYFRRSVRVIALTCVLIFSALLMLGSFDTLGWSDEEHHTHTYEKREHRIFYSIYYEYRHTENYYFEECPDF